jgi:hypothetical protein
MAVDYKMVLNKTIALDTENKVKLQLFQEAKDYDISNAVKIEIKSMKGKTLFSFFDNDASVPIYYFENIEIDKNLKNKKLINLKSAPTIVDLDGNGKNEIIIYGEYYSSIIQNGTGNLLILEENSRGIEQKMPIILGYDYYEMKAYPKEQILIVAQHNMDTEKIGLNDHYLYTFYIYDMKDPLKKIPLLLSKKRINKSDKNIIDKNLPEILTKYKQYKEGKTSKTKEINLVNFVKSYWLTISNNYSLKFIESHLKDEVIYNNKKISKKSFLKIKTDKFKKVKRIQFELDEFLIYQKNGKYRIEYLKSSTLEYKDKKTQTLYRKSLMIIDEVNGKFMIESENDLRVLSDSEIL